MESWSLQSKKTCGKTVSESAAAREKMQIRYFSFGTDFYGFAAD